MKTFFILSLVLTLTAFAGTDPMKVCGEGTVSAKLKQDWKKNSKDRYCVEANCVYADKALEREKCFYQNDNGAQNVVMVTTRDLSVGSMHSRAEKVILNNEEMCTEACVEGVKKKSCMECFKVRALEYKDPEVLNYPEIGRPIKKGTKCYYACMDKEGPIQKTRVLSQECSLCVGANGFTAETFEYLQTKTGVCFELDSSRKLYRVEAKFCKEAGKNLNYTTYYSSKSVAQWLFSQPSGCFEVDELTYGHILKIEVNAEKCGEVSVNDSDRNLIKEENPKAKSPAGSTSSNSSKQ